MMVSIISKPLWVRSREGRKFYIQKYSNMVYNLRMAHGAAASCYKMNTLRTFATRSIRQPRNRYAGNRPTGKPMIYKATQNNLSGEEQVKLGQALRRKATSDSKNNFRYQTGKPPAQRNNLKRKLAYGLGFTLGFFVTFFYSKNCKESEAKPLSKKGFGRMTAPSNSDTRYPSLPTLPWSPTTPPVSPQKDNSKKDGQGWFNKQVPTTTPRTPIQEPAKPSSTIDQIKDKLSFTTTDSQTRTPDQSKKQSSSNSMFASFKSSSKPSTIGKTETRKERTAKIQESSSTTSEFDYIKALKTAVGFLTGFGAGVGTCLVMRTQD